MSSCACVDERRVEVSGDDCFKWQPDQRQEWIRIGPKSAADGNTPLVLHQAGYLVDEVYSQEQALRRLKSSEFDLLLICHTVPELEQSKLVAAVRVLLPELPIVYIRSNGYSTKEYCEMVDNTAPRFLTGLRAILHKKRLRI